MTLQKAVSLRILELCEKRGMSVNRLGEVCGVPQSTLNNIINGASKNPTMLTVQKICSGLNITMTFFFRSDYFKKIDRRIPQVSTIKSSVAACGKIR